VERTITAGDYPKPEEASAQNRQKPSASPATDDRQRKSRGSEEMTDTSAALKRLLEATPAPPDTKPQLPAIASQVVGQIGGGNIIIIGGALPNETLELILQAQAAQRSAGTA
jgi:hypothetical protein